MLSFSSALSSGVCLCVLLLAQEGMASTDVSWCVPGAARSVNGSSDPTTNLIVGQVCSASMLPSCCTDRWGIQCVQRGANWYRQNVGADICGRFAWSSGQEISGQHVPGDFNLVVLGGGVPEFMDVQGPLAANGSVVSSQGFSVNGYAKQPIAISATGNVKLNSGTVFGDVHYGPATGTTYQNVNNTARVLGTVTKDTAITEINFSMVSADLKAMAATLYAYPANGTAGRSTSNDHEVIFTGMDPDLNVFLLPANLLATTTEYSFNVAPGSSALINVVGTAATIHNAAFHGVLPSNGQILWNMPNVTSLSISSVTIPGSVLAPVATNAQLTSGQINGTVVVHDLTSSWAEFHWNPYHGLTPSGCLAWNSKWSCSGDTYLDDTGSVVFPAPEAGFLQIDSTDYTFTDTTVSPPKTYNRTSPTHRLWYSFHPAADSPASKPLAVFFNGGPGGATSNGLFSFNTAPETLDPDWTGGQMIASNPNSWTRFANLLYVDAPATGFSYPMPTSTGAKPSIGLDVYREAATVLQVVVRFLDLHPQVQCNQVILVGESFGGTRAAMMLNHVLNYQQLTSGRYQDPALYGDLVQHFIAGCGLSATASPTQFGSQVLIEPLVAGTLQETYDVNPPDAEGCVSGGDRYQCNVADPPVPASSPNIPSDQVWYWEKVLTAATNLTKPAVLSTALGVSSTSINWFWPVARQGAYSHSSADDKYFTVNTPDMDSTFGSLPPGDTYFVALNKTAGTALVNGGGPTTAPTPASLEFGVYFLNAVLSVNTFITHSDRDNAINVLAIPRAFLDHTTTTNPPSPYPGLVSNVIVDNTMPSGVDRPGEMTIFYAGSNAQRGIRLPEYVDAGHSVSQRMPAQLLADVMNWYLYGK